MQKQFKASKNVSSDRAEDSNVTSSGVGGGGELSSDEQLTADRGFLEEDSHLDTSAGTTDAHDVS